MLRSKVISIKEDGFCLFFIIVYLARNMRAEIHKVRRSRANERVSSDILYVVIEKEEILGIILYIENSIKNARMLGRVCHVLVVDLKIFGNRSRIMQG